MHARTGGHVHVHNAHVRAGARRAAGNAEFKAGRFEEALAEYSAAIRMLQQVAAMLQRARMHARTHARTHEDTRVRTRTHACRRR
jgi:hypothetical protein